MISYRYPEEQQVALIFARELDDPLAQAIIERGQVLSSAEARHLSQFFWRMVDLSAQRVVRLPFEEGSEYWTEKLLTSLGGYMKKAGYGAEWEEESDKA